MRRDRLFFLLFCGVLLSGFSPFCAAAECVPIHQAGNYVGETQCVTGKVLRVKAGSGGVHFLDFCEDQMACPFTVVVFASDLPDVGDVRRLEGRVVEIKGEVKLYQGRPEIVLKRISQITGGMSMVPPLPKNFDVENRGHFSAGRLHPSKKAAKTKAVPAASALYGNEADVEEP